MSYLCKVKLKQTKRFMKKLIFGFMLTLASVFTFAQTNEEVRPTSKQNAVEATQEGNVTVGVNTTGFGFNNVDGVTKTNVGVTVGAFAKQNFAVVATVGYGAITSKHYNVNDWYYGGGLKYYINSQIPLQVDWRGSTGNSYHPSTSYVGVEGGYAWFLSKNFSIEPKLRYDFSTKTQYENVFSGALGFNAFF